MKTSVRCFIALIAAAGSLAYGDIPKINIEVADSSGQTTFKGATDATGIFATPRLPPGDYVVRFGSKSAPKGSHFTLILVAGAKKMFAEAITAEKLGPPGVAMRIEVRNEDHSILGTVSEEDKATRIGKNGKLMVWIPKRIDSNLPAHWAESDSPEAKLMETSTSFSRQNIQDRQNKGISPGD